MATDKIERIPGADAFCIALILLPVCIVPTVISERFRPYKPIQIIHSQPVVLKDQARIQKAALRFTAGLPWTCEQVRQAWALLTKEQIERYARRLTAEQRAEAMKCLRDRRERGSI